MRGVSIHAYSSCGYADLFCMLLRISSLFETHLSLSMARVASTISIHSPVSFVSYQCECVHGQADLHDLCERMPACGQIVTWECMCCIPLHTSSRTNMNVCTVVVVEGV